jgi:hypothetical protein
MTPVAWVLLVLGVVAVLFVADRLVARLPVSPREHRRRPAPGGSGAGLAGGELVESFHPPSRHVAEERERRLLDVQLVASGAPGPVDLDAGVAVLDPQAPSTTAPAPDPR